MSKIRATVNWINSLNVLHVIAVFSVIVILLGSLELVQSQRLSSSNETMVQFIQCQADYNQKSAKARDARVDAQNAENNSLYGFLITLPALFDRKNVKSDTHATFLALQKALSKHQHRLRQYQLHPFPPEPNKTCGTIS